MDAIINEFSEKFSEHLEMYEEPNKILVHILSNEIYHVREYNTYLQRRLNYLENKIELK